jgi:DnaJ-related protein SCJ1
MLPAFLFAVLLLILDLTFAADLYKTLDIHKSASEKDIRHAYKKLSRKFHPDKNKDPDAETKFVEIAHGLFNLPRSIQSSYALTAYEVLSDPTVQHFLSSCLYTESVARNAISMTAMER